MPKKAKKKARPGKPTGAELRIRKAIGLAVQYGGIDGSHHKTWVIDQMVRALAGTEYDAIVGAACDGPDGRYSYDWDVGIAP